MIDSLTIRGGRDKRGVQERIRELTIRQGEIVGIVGPTGSGKSALIEDIEQLAQGDTATGRTIWINGAAPSHAERTNPRKKIVAQLSQNMSFLANMTVEAFLLLHAKCRHVDERRITEVMEIANSLTGEPVRETDDLTILSGGQSRALMVADVAVISDSPIVLVDEIENAGIKKHEALRLLAGRGKIVLLVTHDPVLALMAERRIVMRNGGMSTVVCTSPAEKDVCRRLQRIDEWMLALRERVRQGEQIGDVEDPQQIEAEAAGAPA